MKLLRVLPLLVALALSAELPAQGIIGGGGGGGGTITGAGTDNNIARWDGTGALQDSNCAITDGGALACGSGTFDLSRWDYCFTIFDLGADLTTSVDIPSIFAFQDDYGVGVDKIWCETDANTASINFQRDDGSAANVLSASLVCDTGGQTSCASGCDVNTIQAAEDNFAVGEKLDFLTVAIDAGVRRVNVCLYGIKE